MPPPADKVADHSLARWFLVRVVYDPAMVGSSGVAKQSPIFGQDLRFAQIMEGFTRQKLISTDRVEALALSVLP